MFFNIRSVFLSWLLLLLSVPGVWAQAVPTVPTTIAVTASPPVANFGDLVTLTATVGGGVGRFGAPTGSVQFLAGTVVIGTAALDSAATATLPPVTLPAGTNSITASYPGDSTYMASSTSSPATVAVGWPQKLSGTPSTQTLSAGTGPVAMALNPVTHRLYVANNGSNDVTVIDSLTNAIVVASIRVPASPAAIAVNSNTNRIYVAADPVVVIDGQTNTVVGSISLGMYSDSVTVNSQTNQIYVGTNCSVSVIDGATNQLMQQISNFCGPFALAVSPMTGQAYIGARGDNASGLVESLTNRGLGGMSLGLPQAYALNPPAIYLGGFDNPRGFASVLVFDEFSNLTTTKIAVSSDGNYVISALAVNPVDNRIYAAAVSGIAGQAATVTAIDGATNTILGNPIPVGQATPPWFSSTSDPKTIAIDANSNLVYVANDLSNDVTIIDGDLRTTITSIAVGNSPSALALNPDSCSLYVANFASGSVTLINTVASGPGICLSSTSLIFPGQALGTTSPPQAVTLTNTGNAALTISSLVPTGAFSETDNCAGATIPVGGQCSIQVSFAPTSAGILKGSISINSNGAGLHRIALSGAGTLPTTTTLAADFNPAVYGQKINLVASVTSSQGDVASGSVAFYDGPTLLGYAAVTTLGTAPFVTPPLRPAGSSHSFTAVYLGNVHYAASQSIPLIETVIKAATTTAFGGPFYAPAPLTEGQQVVMPVTVSVDAPGSGDPTEPYGVAYFKDGQSSLGTSTLVADGYGGALASITVPSLRSGAHSIAISYPGDSNLLPSTSAPYPLTVLPAASGGTGTGTGGTCACTKTGDYVAPAGPVAPNKGTLQSSTWVLGSNNWTETWFSPNQKYQFEDIISIDPNGVRTDELRVTRKSDGSSVYDIGSIPLANWGFSPDDDRLFYETLNPTLNFGEIKVVDLAVSPAVAIVQTNPSVGATSALNGFSPSGAYFIYYFIDKRPSTSAPNMEEVNLQVYKIQGATLQTIVLQRYLPLALTPGAGRTFAIGFSPDSPESSLVYEYATGATTTGTITNVSTKQWTMETLPNPLVRQTTDTITTYDFWRYSPCGDKIGLVKQASQTATDVYLYDTTTGLHLPAVRVDAGNVGVFLITTAAGHYARYIDTNTNLNNYIPLAPNACVGGKPAPPLPNTPSGTSITLTDHNTATQDGVSIVFDSVTVPGDSTIKFITAASGPPPPSGFEILGNPSVYFDITTSATYTGDVTICIHYDALPATITTPTTMLHYVGTAPNGSWQDVTFFNDVTNGEICGRASSLSPFVIGSIVTVAPPDRTPPAISNVPANFTVQATSSAGAVVSYTPPAASDAVSGVVPVNCVPVSGSTFALGTTTVACTASDAAGNIATASFAVSVVDTTPPAISNVPANLTVQATSSAGAVVSYTTPAANDAVAGVVPVNCVPASGSTFAVGTTTVACTASDATGNVANAGFTVTISPVTTGVPLVSLSRSTLYFGEEESRENQVRTVVLSNTGTGLLVIDSIHVTGDFIRVSARRGDCGGSLAVGASCSIAIRFSPTGSGLRKGVLTINTNAADSPHTVGLVGRNRRPDQHMVTPH